VEVYKLRKAFHRIRTIPKTAHKPYLIIFFELIFWVVANRGELNYYFDYELFLKGKRQGDYLKSHEFHKVAKELNSPEYYPMLEDKYFFSKILDGQGLRFPRNLYLIDHAGIFNIESKEFLTEEEFLQNDFDGFCKLNNGFGGKNIFRVEVLNKNLQINESDISVSDFVKFLGGKKYLIQERIVQHNDMNVLNPSCMNTMRILTIRTGQTFHLYQVYLRIGINNNYVDNGLSGNIMVGVEKDTGTLMEYAFAGAIIAEESTLDRHPQTRTVFKGFKIPYYEESVEMVKSLHLLFHQFYMIGWDIGITPDGPIVIEGNNISTLYPFQVLYGGLKPSFFDLAQAYQLSQS
jgi:hypothetical protein